MKSNADLQKDVQDAIKWEPLLHAAEIGVTVNEGIVTLTGTVDNYAKKMEAERAAKKVAGVIAIVEKIEVQVNLSWNKNDNEIATEVVNALAMNWAIPNDKVKVIVNDGWVTLEGDLHWEYQRVAIKEAVKDLVGVAGVSNNTKIKPESRDLIEANEIKSAIERHWAFTTSTIKVDVSGTKVTLIGTVPSWYQKDEAEKIAWKARGVWNVVNDLVIEYNYSLAELDD